MKRVLLPVFVCLTTLFLAGCHKKPENKAPSKIVRLNISQDINSFDPRKVRELNSVTVMKMLYEGLTRIDNEGEVILSAAESYTLSDDLKTYTFTLRDSVWSNGQKVTANDFAYAWRKVLDQNFPSDNAFQLYVIKNARFLKRGEATIDEVGIKVIDEKTLEIELEDPTPYFLKLIAHPVFFPIHEATELNVPDWAQKIETLVTNGPFYLKDWRPQDVMEIRPRHNYWDKDVVKLEGIQLTMVGKEDTEFMMYEKGELDWAGSPTSVLPIDTIKSVKEKNQLNTHSFLITHFLRINVDKPPFYHPDMRKAFALAIDRDAIVEHVLRGGQTPAYTLVPPSFKLPTESSLREGGKEKAREYFDKACMELGYTSEMFPEIVYTYVAGERNQMIAQAIQQQWLEAFDILVTLEAVEGKVSYSRLSKQDYQLLAGSWVADFDDPINFLEVFKYKKASTNNTQWESKYYVQELDKSNKTMNPAERSQILARAESILLEDLPIMPIYHGVMLYVKNDNIRDVVLSSLGSLDFKWADVQSNKEIASSKEENKDL